MTTAFYSREPHPIAALFPVCEESIEAIAEDMRCNGYDHRHPIVLYQGKILDGRHRWEAAQRAGVRVREREHTEYDGDPLDFVVRSNLHRRHLTTSQRAMVAERLATLKLGRPEKGPKDPVSIDAAAESLNVSPKSVKRARTVRREAPELAEKVERGEMTVGAAVAEIKAKKAPKATEPTRDSESLTPKRVRDAVAAFLSMDKHERAAYFAYIDSWRREHGE